MESLLKSFDNPKYQVAAACAGVVVVGGAIYLITRRESNESEEKPLPPGPRCWPYIGPPSLLSLDSERLRTLRDIYGPVISWHVSTYNFVCFNDFAAIQEALCRVNAGAPFTGRVSNPLGDWLTQKKGIVAAEGERWQIHRRFALHRLRDLGFGRANVEEAIRVQADWLLDQLADAQAAADRAADASITWQAGARVGEPFARELAEARRHGAFDPRMCFTRSVNNVVSRLVFGKFLSEDPDFDTAVNSIATIMRESGKRSRMFLFLRLLQLPMEFFFLFRMMFIFWRFERYIVRIVLEYKRSFVESRAQDSLVDAFLAQQRTEDREHGVGQHTFDDFQLVRMAEELFSAGTDTIVSTLRWALILMAKHREVQQRVQQEIDAVLGSRPPALTDRTRMRYTEAVLYEVQRYSSLVALAVRRVTDDCEMRGYRIQKNALAIINHWAAHRDPLVWPHPTRFSMDNFLGAPPTAAEEKEKDAELFERRPLVRTDVMLPFSLGKRECLGENLARSELFIFFVRVLQKFTVLPASGNVVLDAPDAEVEIDNPIFRIPAEHPLTFVARS